MTKKLYWKSFDKGFICNGYKYKRRNTWNYLKGDIGPPKRGFKACEKLEYTFSHRDPDQSCYALVELGEVFSEGRGQVISDKLKIIKKFKTVEEATNSLTEKQKVDIIRKCSFDIVYMDNPSESLQLLAVDFDGRNIDYIKNPSEVVQLAAVKQIIDNPVKKDPF